LAQDIWLKASADVWAALASSLTLLEPVRGLRANADGKQKWDEICFVCVCYGNHNNHDNGLG